MSLLEVCVVITLICSLTFFAAPSLIRARETYQLDAVAWQVAGRMQWTRIKAISRNRDCRIRIDSPTSYIIECQSSTTWQPDENVSLPRGFRITASAWPEFHARGNVAPTATLTIWDVHAKTKAIVVNITGRVRVD
jgi:Tfp pilus assembly protein FimT